MPNDDVLDITPDPKVLLALTHTPLKPIDALCELIDNAIDAFFAADSLGIEVKHRLVDISIPGHAETRRGEGTLRVYDNGPGLDRDGLGNTLKAGFSNKNRFDTLGLFGMGFNIATGKLGRKTIVTTARIGDETALRVTLDLPQIVSQRSFEIPVETIEKPAGFSHGTIVEVSSWWPDGAPNSGFAAQLMSVAKPLLRERIGRRYATILRRTDPDPLRILVNGDAVEGFEHCVWAEERFVERRGWGNIPARFQIDQVVHTQRRCLKDGSPFPAGADSCLECGSNESRTVEERIRGWVGVQRFDDNNRFGIDLIRKGRAIRVGEKDAFFNHVNDEVGEAIKEYPTDQQTGRIVGEIHLDHVPVDFQKQDFERTTEEWTRAMEHLRGGSLLPSAWDSDRNETPVSKLFQGYRKVRNIGRQDMYMGTYDETTGKAVRITRDVETTYFRKFLAKESGYYDDSKWWELVESATLPPITTLPECPDCGYQNLASAEICEACARILLGKACIECEVEIVASATACPNCGTSQVPEVHEPWRCQICGNTNSVDDEVCTTCESLRGSENPTDPDVLRKSSASAPELSFEPRTFALSGERSSEPLEVNAWRTGELKPRWNGDPVPTIVLRRAGVLDVFIHEGHVAFARYGVRPIEAVATAVAQYLYNLRSDLTGRPEHSVTNIAAIVLQEVWGEGIATENENLVDAIELLFSAIGDKLVGSSGAAEYYGELDQFDQRSLADRLISAGRLEDLTRLVESGEYLRFASSAVLAKYFHSFPDEWFGLVWSDRLPDTSIAAAMAESAREQLVGVYSRCLDDCAAFVRFRYSDPLIVARARASLRFLEQGLA